MPDTKITALTAISTVDPAVDVLPIVDVSDTTMAASGTTKKITSNQILGAGGTATLASATITGDLTVATSVLKVDSANTRVGINTTTINGGPFNVKISSAIDAKFVVQDGFTTGNVRLAAVDNAYSNYKIMDYSALSHAWYNSGSTAMTLNSTGLGVGVSPSYKLDVLSSGVIAQFLRDLTVDTGIQLQADNSGSIIKSIGNQGIRFNISSADAVTLDSSGNVGVGVTPSAKLHVEGGGAQGRFSVASASDARHEYYRNGIREGLITWDANLIGLYATQSSGEVVIASSNTIRVRVKTGGQVRFVPIASDPASAEAGDVYYNSTSNKLKCYNGTTWNDLF